MSEKEEQCLMSEVLEKLKTAIVDGDDDAAQTQAEAALSEGITPVKVLDDAIVPGMEEVGQRWRDNEYFMPDVILAAGAFKSAMAVVEPRLKEQETRSRGKIVVGVVEGDVHDLGKTIVIAMLAGAGFEVIDLGENIPKRTFIEKVKEHEPDILGVGAYMTTTMLFMKDIIAELKAEGLRVKVMVGGVPTTQEFADEIGADAWGKDALDAVGKAKKLMAVS